METGARGLKAGRHVGVLMESEWVATCVSGPSELVGDGLVCVVERALLPRNLTCGDNLPKILIFKGDHMKFGALICN